MADALAALQAAVSDAAEGDLADAVAALEAAISGRAPAPGPWQTVSAEDFEVMEPPERWGQNFDGNSANSNAQDLLTLEGFEVGEGWALTGSYNFSNRERRSIYLGDVHSTLTDPDTAEELPNTSPIATLPEAYWPLEEQTIGSVTIGVDGVIRPPADPGVYLNPYAQADYDVAGSFTPEAEVPWQDTSTFRWREAGGAIELDGFLISKPWLGEFFGPVLTLPETAWPPRGEDDPVGFTLGYVQIHGDGLLIALAGGEFFDPPRLFFDGLRYPLS